MIHAFLQKAHSPVNAEEAFLAYIECEAFQEALLSHPSYAALIEASLQQFASTVGIDWTENETHLNTSLSFNWIIEEKVPALLRSLKEAGVHIVAAPNVQSSEFSRFLPSLESKFQVSFDHIIETQSPLSLYSHCDDSPSFIRDLAEHLNNTGAVLENLLPEQVLVVSSSVLRGVRPATAAGYMTAYIDRQRQTGFENDVYELGRAEPTVKIHNLTDILTKIPAMFGSAAK